MRTLKNLLTGLYVAPLLLSAQNPIQLETVHWASGLTGIVDIAHAGDDRIFVVQRAGFIRIVTDSNQVAPTPFLNIQSQVNSGGSEQGLLGLAFDPDHSNNGHFYVYYTTGPGNGTSVVSRFTVGNDPDIADPASEVVMYTWPQPYSNHNGGDLEFGPDGMLYIGFGDGGSANDPQNYSQRLSEPLGDMIRIQVLADGSWAVPADNPWVNVTGDTLPEIWASGLRNPWRFGFDRLTGDLWIGDVGQNAWEEIDFWPAGTHTGPNFGWRCYEGNNAHITSGCQGASAYVFPVAVHSNPGIGGTWCSAIGGRVYRGTEFPRLEGKYIYTDYCAGEFYLITPDGQGGFTGALGLASSTFGYVAIGENNVGDLFVANTNNGSLRKIRDRCPMAPPAITVGFDDLTSTVANAYQWYLNGTLIPGANGQVFTPAVSGAYHVVGTFAGNCQLASDTVNFSVTGLENGESPAGRVFPNPAQGMLFLELPAMGGGAWHVSLVDALGREVLARRLIAHAGRATLAVDDVPAGAYLLRVVNDPVSAPRHEQRVVITGRVR